MLFGNMDPSLGIGDFRTQVALRALEWRDSLEMENAYLQRQLDEANKANVTYLRELRRLQEEVKNK